MHRRLHRRSRLAAEITVVLVAKVAALFAIWHFWFADADRVRVNDARVAQALVAPASSHSDEAKRDAGP
jgi:hypothetical protein